MTLHIQKGSLNWALKFVQKFGDTDILPVPFEFEAIKYDWDNIEPYLISEDILNWIVRPARTLLAPKSALGFRIVIQIDPLDFLIYTSLVYEIASDIEKHRIPIKQKRVFSYRFDNRKSIHLFKPKIWISIIYCGGSK